jgi:hypothetical protein
MWASNQHKTKVITDTFIRGAGYEPNIVRPTTFNEKIQWLKLHYRDDLMTVCTDKYAVREHVEREIGAEYLVPLIGVWDTPEKIPFDELPQKFVLKTNNSSGTNIVCTDKSALDRDAAIAQLTEWMRPEANHYNFTYEWCYKNIAAKILAEEFIDALDGDLLDYKLLCFDGKVRYIFVCSERKTGLKVDFFDTDWNHLPFTRHYPNSDKAIPRPERLAEMISVAETLAAPFPFVRVDLYEIESRVQFGELTFYPGGGFEAFDPHEWDERLGTAIRLPRRRFGFGKARPRRTGRTSTRH